MQTNAANLSDRDMRDIADYFAAQRPLRASYQLDTARVAAGRTRAEELGCGACHLPSFGGRDAIPRLAGQTPGYLASQLQAFSAGRRAHGSGRDAAPPVTLSEEDAESLAHFLASLE